MYMTWYDQIIKACLITQGYCLHRGGGPQIGEVTCSGSPHLSGKRDQIKMRDYMDRQVTSPLWGPTPSCKQGLNHWENTWKKKNSCMTGAPVHHNALPARLIRWNDHVAKWRSRLHVLCSWLTLAINKVRLYCSFFLSLLETCNQVVLVPFFFGDRGEKRGVPFCFFARTAIIYG